MSSAATRSAMQRSRLYQQQFNLPEDELLVDGQTTHNHSHTQNAHKDGQKRASCATIEWCGGWRSGRPVSVAQWSQSLADPLPRARLCVCFRLCRCSLIHLSTDVSC